jgi:hypothetical protein
MLFRRVIAVGFRALLVAAAVSTGGEERVNPSTEMVRQGGVQRVSQPAPAGQWVRLEDTPPPEDPPPPEETPTPEPTPTPTELP